MHSVWLCFYAAVALGVTAAPACSRTLQVTITALRYLPEEIKAEVGDTVEWINKDIIAHTATALGRWDVIIPANGSGRVVLKKPGQVVYYCRFHPNMKAGITIAAPQVKPRRPPHHAIAARFTRMGMAL